MSAFNPETAPDLTRRAPRSPRVRLGGFVILARLLDKGRATVAGKAGDYRYGSGLDQHFFEFTRIDPPRLFARIAEGGGDGDILEWILAHAGNRPGLEEIARWTSEIESTDSISLTFDLLDLDDYVSFGGQA